MLELLFDRIDSGHRGEVPNRNEPIVHIPVLKEHEVNLTVFNQRQYIESAKRSANTSRITDQQIKALNLVDSFAND
ncbi:MAG: hypothetical protein OSA51_00860 [Octadecabacter sp.]|nr:hypothetical protein [Octadecabacter sp.]